MVNRRACPESSGPDGWNESALRCTVKSDERRLHNRDRRLHLGAPLGIGRRKNDRAVITLLHAGIDRRSLRS